MQQQYYNLYVLLKLQLGPNFTYLGSLKFRLKKLKKNNNNNNKFKKNVID